MTAVSNIQWDQSAEDLSNTYFLMWMRLLRQQWPHLPLQLAARHVPGKVTVSASEFVTGAYNFCSVVTFEDGFKAVVRFPIFGKSIFRKEKTRNERWIMKLLSEQTRMPIPNLLGDGEWDLGPYSVSAYVEGSLLSRCLKDKTRPSDPDEISLLSQGFHAMAKILLHLSKPTFQRIGALEFNEKTGWNVTRRPLTLNMNELARVGDYIPSELPERPFERAYDYFMSLVEQQIRHLEIQRNDVIQDEEDCRKKYVARCLFRRIIQRIRGGLNDEGPFHLYCDDLRPSNVIVSESDLSVTGVIDWEFTYVAPAEFTYTAPWWILFDSPEEWELDKFWEVYIPRFSIFLQALISCEDDEIEQGVLSESQRLSSRMKDSIHNGLFWICLAARKSFMFDEIYWKCLDEKYFGPPNFENRMMLLTEDERNQMTRVVSVKMVQLHTREKIQHLSFDEMIEL